jgi:hypothetical protein
MTYQSDSEAAPRPPLDPTPVVFPTHAAPEYLKAYTVMWDERLPLTGEGRARLERALRRAVLAELAEADFEGDLTITTIDDPESRGIRIERA